MNKNNQSRLCIELNRKMKVNNKILSHSNNNNHSHISRIKAIKINRTIKRMIRRNIIRKATTTTTTTKTKTKETRTNRMTKSTIIKINSNSSSNNPNSL